VSSKRLTFPADEAAIRELRAGDEVLVIADPDQYDALAATFSTPA